MELENWFVIATSKQLKNKPLGRKLLGKKFVIFRDSFGKVIALEDRCPHKNVSLSLGTIAGDNIQCPYHGWKFNSTGECVEQPCRGPQEKFLLCQVPQYTVVEQDGWIWIYPIQNKIKSISENPINNSPPRYLQDPKLHWFELHNVMKAPADLILENGLDCSHTGFVHKGLFRSAPTQYVTADICETENGMHVETSGEQNSEQLDSRFLIKKGESVQHTDEFISPHTVKINYSWGKAKFVTILICIPEDEMTTRVYTRIGMSYPPITPIIIPFIRYLTAKVVAQDKIILENQASQIKFFAKRSFISMASDTPSNWFFRAYQKKSLQIDHNENFKNIKVKYKL
jgi:phenylpropionate dioxygenase-like ring-hydroxylating dioxygenase large terminal subunit